ncbi:unnamed protein product [Nezara viridula]|uniref:Gustatory receptor n=1 Tax=Nezara viridula TaxID=85310 RepID=A0A9P0H926_NEZVI|nr:unnamed protein product [Nezara viridula]
MAIGPDTSRIIQHAEILSTHKYFRFIYSLSAVFGVFPFILHRGRYRISYFFSVLSVIICIFVGFVAMVLSHLFLFVLPKGKNFVLKAELVLLLCFTVSLSTMHIITASTSIWRVRAVRQIIGILEEVDAILSIRLKMDFGLSDLTAISLNLLLDCWLFYQTQSIHYIMFGLILVTNIWLVISQFSVLASLINSRLEGACECLNELKMRPDSPYKDQKVAILSDVHNKLCDAGEILHTAFAWMLTIMIAMCFVGIIVLTFNIYASYRRDNNFDIRLLLFQDDKLLWILYYFTVTWKIASSSSQLNQKVTKLCKLDIKII